MQDTEGRSLAGAGGVKMEHRDNLADGEEDGGQASGGDASRPGPPISTPAPRALAEYIDSHVRRAHGVDQDVQKDRSHLSMLSLLLLVRSLPWPYLC